MGESVQPAGRQLSEDPVYPTRLIVWFQGRDLRLHDNPLLSTAMRHASPKEVIPVFIFDPSPIEETTFGSVKTGPIHAKFIIESVAVLRESLRAIGSDLLIGIGEPAALLPRLTARATYLLKVRGRGRGGDE